MVYIDGDSMAGLLILALVIFVLFWFDSRVNSYYKFSISKYQILDIKERTWNLKKIRIIQGSILFSGILMVSHIILSDDKIGFLGISGISTFLAVILANSYFWKTDKSIQEQFKDYKIVIKTEAGLRIKIKAFSQREVDSIKSHEGNTLFLVRNEFNKRITLDEDSQKMWNNRRKLF